MSSLFDQGVEEAAPPRDKRAVDGLDGLSDEWDTYISSAAACLSVGLSVSEPFPQLPPPADLIAEREQGT